VLRSTMAMTDPISAIPYHSELRRQRTLIFSGQAVSLGNVYPA